MDRPQNLCDGVRFNLQGNREYYNSVLRLRFFARWLTDPRLHDLTRDTVLSIMLLCCLQSTGKVAPQF